MVDTVRTRAALQGLLADNSAGLISAQDLRDMLASVIVLNPPNQQTGASYTFALADSDQAVIFNRASAQAVTIPADSAVAFPVGTRIRCLREGSGIPTIGPDTGVTLHKPANIRPCLHNGALVKKAADLTNQNVTTIAPITWDTDVYDVGGWHESVINPSRLTVPTGVSRVRVGGHVRAANVNANQWGLIYISKNGTRDYDGSAGQESETAGNTRDLTVWSPVLEVTAGDYFELQIQQLTDTAIDIVAARSWFAIEAVETIPVGSIAYQYGFVTLTKMGTNEWSIEGPALG